MNHRHCRNCRVSIPIDKLYCKLCNSPRMNKEYHKLEEEASKIIMDTIGYGDNTIEYHGNLTGQMIKMLQEMKDSPLKNALVGYLENNDYMLRTHINVKYGDLDD